MISLSLQPIARRHESGIPLSEVRERPTASRTFQLLKERILLYDLYFPSLAFTTTTSEKYTTMTSRDDIRRGDQQSSFDTQVTESQDALKRPLVESHGINSSAEEQGSPLLNPPFDVQLQKGAFKTEFSTTANPQDECHDGTPDQPPASPSNP